MAEIELGEQTLSIKTVDGKEYVIADPLDLMLWLEEEGLDGGKLTREKLGKVKAKIMEVSGVPAMTASQVIKFVTGLTGYGEELKKNIGLMPNSATGTDTPPPIPPATLPSASDSTRISPASRPRKPSQTPTPSQSPSPANPST